MSGAVDNPYQSATVTSDAPRRDRRWALRLTIGAAALLLITVAIGAAFLLGVLAGEGGAYHRRSVRLMEQAQSVLNELPDRFGRVTVDEGSAGRAFLSGTVDSQEDFDLLLAEMQRVFGAATGEEMTLPVEVAAGE